jgi:hypothetical protein
MVISESKTRFAWAFFIVLVTSCAHARSPVAQPSRTGDEPIPLPASATVFLGCGFLLVENHGATLFSAVLAGKEMKQSAKDPSVVVLDGVLVRAATTSAAAMGLPSLRGTDLLGALRSISASAT